MTIRTVDDFNNATTGLLKDNITKDIIESVLRDVVESSMLAVDQQSPVATAITAVAGKHYQITMSSMTASVDFELPTATAAGEKIRVSILDGSASHELILKGDATGSVTINGGTAATEWSRLFIAGESVLFESTSTTNWNVVQDGRKPQYAKYDGSGGSAQSITDATWTPVSSATLATTIEDDYSLGGTETIDSITTRIITPRRVGKYLCNGNYYSASSTGTGRVQVDSDGNGSGILSNKTYHSSGNVAANTTGVAIFGSTSTRFHLRVLNNVGGSLNILASQTANYIEVLEVLE